MFGRALFRPLRVDHQFIELDNVVLVADGATVFGVEDLNHD
jgi:hypothetical protein